MYQNEFLWSKGYQIELSLLGLIESGSCIYPNTVLEHKKFVMEKWLEPCFSKSVFTWNNITHSYIQVIALLLVCLIRKELQNLVSKFDELDTLEIEIC